MYILNDKQINEVYSPPKFNEDERRVAFVINDREADQLLSRESDLIKAAYILLLGYFKETPTRLDFDPDKAHEDIEFIRNEYCNSSKFKFEPLTSQQKYVLYNKVFVALEYNRFGDEERKKLEAYIADITKYHYDLVSIFDEVTDWLRVNRIEIPSYRILQNMISEKFKKEKKRTIQKCSKILTKKTKASFNSMLFSNISSELFSSVRHESRDFYSASILRELKIFSSLECIYKDAEKLVSTLGISKGRIRYYASLMTSQQLGTIKSKSLDEVYLLLACFIYYRFTSLNDFLADALIYQVRLIEGKAKEYARNKLLSVREEMEGKIEDAADMLQLFLDSNVESEDIRSKGLNIIPKGELQQVILYMKKSSIEKDIYFWEHIDASTKSIKSLLRGIVLRLRFVDAAQKGSLYAQLQKALEEINATGEIQFIDNRLFRAKKKHLYHDDQLISNRAEFSIYQLVSSRLQDTHWYVENSKRFIPFDDMLVKEPVWKNLKQELIKNVNSKNLNTPVVELVESGLKSLEEKLQSIPKRIQTKENESVILERKDGKDKWTIKRYKSEKLVNNRLFEKMSKVDLSKVIYSTAKSTNFFDEIKHITGRRKNDDALSIFIACMIANGTRQGIYKMSDLCDFSHDMLKTFQANFMSVENIRNACDVISDATAKLKVFEHYNYRPNFVHGSTDGQKLTSRRSTRRTRHSTKYFGQEKGLSGQALIINYIPANAVLSSLNTHESHNLFDLLYNNTTEIEIDAVATDTHGVNRFNFAILNLSDWAHHPRYAKTELIVESLFQVNETKNGWTLSLKDPIDVKAIYDGWDYVQRILVSLHQKEICQSDLVAKLSRSSPSDHSLKALREYDRLLKAIYILDYIDDESLRRYVQTSLNRGEAYHQLQRAFENVGSGRGFRGKSDNEIDLWYECSRLMANCMIHFNSVVLNSLLLKYERQNDKELIERLKHISPVAWVHIIMGGKYQFNELSETPDIMAMVNSMLAA